MQQESLIKPELPWKLYGVSDCFESQNREEKFLLCYENAQSEKDINLRTKKENKCQRERFSNYPKLRDSFKD